MFQSAEEATRGEAGEHSIAQVPSHPASQLGPDNERAQLWRRAYAKVPTVVISQSKSYRCIVYASDALGH